MPSDIFAQIDQMRALGRSSSWQEIERVFRSVAANLAGETRAREIESIDLGAYERALTDGIARAYRLARDHHAAAIYFEYDLDNLWASAFFICGTYRPEEANDDEWACDWLAEVRGPSLDCFAELYQKNRGFDNSPFAAGSTLYLVARTVAVFGRASEAAGMPPCVLCMGFHDQDPIQRLRGAD